MFTDCRTGGETIARTSTKMKAFALSLVLVICGWSAASAQSIICPADASIACADVYNLDVAGQATVENPNGQSVNVTYSDAEMMGEGCSRTITRTWVAIFGTGQSASSASCTQVISTSDNQGPVISGVTPVIEVQCADDVPGFQAATAEACAGGETVSMFASHTGRADKICSVSTAFGPGADWAVWLPDLASSNYDISVAWVFDANGGKFEQYIDGTARFYGRIINTSNPAHGFNVDFWFRNRRTWDGPYGWNSELNREYKNDLGLACATTNHINWDYYEMVNGISTLTGDGSLAGSILHMSHMPANYFFGFQVGVGANNKNCNEGISGWFTYEGFINGSAVEGHGDVNADLSCGLQPELCTNDDNYTYIYSAKNDCGYGTIIKQSILVNDTIAPEFTNCPAAITQECSLPVPAVASNLSATDNCSASADIVIAFEGEETETDGCTTWITRTWSALDECGNRSECVQVITLVDTTNPVFNAYPGYISTECDVEPTWPTANDNCDDNVTITIAGEELQSGGCMGVLARTYRATDNCGNFTEIVQYIALLDTTAPSFQNVPANNTVQCNTVSLGSNGLYFSAGSVVGVDNCGLAVTVTYAEQVVPTDDNCPNSYNIVRTWTGVDYCENVATITRTTQVIDSTDPIFTSFPQDLTIACNAPIPAVVFPTATDNCDDNVTITLSTSEVAGDCPQERTIMRTFRGTDNCGNEVVETQEIHVVDEVAPVFTAGQTTQYTYQCDVTIPSIQPVATDNCGSITYTSVDSQPVGNSCSRFFNRTWTAADQCGNTSTFVQTITIVDTTAPVITGSFDTTRPCDNYGGIYVSATDNCNNITWSTSDVHVSGGCAGTIIRTYVASDICGNQSAPFTQTIHLTDNVAPSIVSETADLTIQCDDVVPVVIAPVFADNCSESIDVDYAYSEEV